MSEFVAVCRSVGGVQVGGFGGLYYAKDLEERTGDEPLYIDANGVDIADAKFAIGPSTGRESIDNGRVSINFDRGPCKNSVLNQVSRD